MFSLHLVDKIGGAGEPHSRGFSNLKSGLKRAPSGEKRREEMLWAKSSLPRSFQVRFSEASFASSSIHQQSKSLMCSSSSSSCLRPACRRAQPARWEESQDPVYTWIKVD